MYVPEQYKAPNVEWIHETVRDCPLALFTTNGKDSPSATHLPSIPVDETMAGGSGVTGLESLDLLGHMNRANPHWSELAVGQGGLLVFSGPNAYVSPAWYPAAPAAPTWDFVAVHVRVRIVALLSRDETYYLVCETARRLEARFGREWDQRGSQDYFRKILPGVGGFRMSVTGAEAMYKLSQEKDRSTRDSIRKGLSERGLPNDGCVASDIARLRGEH